MYFYPNAKTLYLYCFNLLEIQTFHAWSIMHALIYLKPAEYSANFLSYNLMHPTDYI